MLIVWSLEETETYGQTGNDTDGQNVKIKAEIVLREMVGWDEEVGHRATIVCRCTPEPCHQGARLTSVTCYSVASWRGDPTGATVSHLPRKYSRLGTEET